MSRWISLVVVMALVGAGIAAIVVGRMGMAPGTGGVVQDGPAGTADPDETTDPVTPDAGDESQGDDGSGDTGNDDADSGDDGADDNGADGSNDADDPGNVPEPEPEPTWSYQPPGALEGDTRDGSATMTVFAPDMVFPVKDAPAYPQSQVYRPGGQVPGDQCQASNYEYPWWDNFCETRTSKWSTPYCSEQGVHLGQDIRVGTPEGCEEMRRQSPSERGIYALVAAEDGHISNVGRYTVNVRAGGRIYRYLHMNMARLQVSLGDEVTAGQVLGYLSNDFGGAATTFHLHFEIKMNTAEHGWTFVPPYLSLVEAYQRREGNPGEMIGAMESDDPVVIGASAEE